ncbi:MAG: response regulator [Armatimonadetes bacterium]|nr:response regulator [Armatimonadota bacterium]MDE2207320.1 response regulator [Armatimonadota bacterium]
MSPTPPHVLVVDDEPLMLELIRRILAGTGVTVSTVDTGSAACSLLGAPPRPDIVIADLSMPVVDGMAVTAVAGALSPPIPVILLTGHKITADVPTNVRAVILKPFRRAELLGQLVTILGNAMNLE